MHSLENGFPHLSAFNHRLEPRKVVKRVTLGQCFFCQLVHMVACEKVNILTRTEQARLIYLVVTDFVPTDRFCALCSLLFTF